MPSRLFIALAVVAGLCIGCSGTDDRVIEAEVEVLCGEAGRRADIAEMRLVARGRAAILHLETGLYTADPPARRRIVRVLAKIGDPEALPILEHLAARDPNDEVRDKARAAAAELATRGL